jgi:RNase P subunit p30
MTNNNFNTKTKRGKLARDDILSKKESKQYMDLMVMIPKQPQPLLFVSSLIDRLESAGFTTIALTHTIYGPPPSPSANAEIMERLKVLLQQQQGRSRRGGLRILTRLHAVVETLSDVGRYTLQQDNSSDSKKDKSTNNTTGRESLSSSYPEVLLGYDLVSLSPRNDAVFQAVCQTATAAEIITLDYYSAQQRRLPFKIRNKDVKAAVQRGVVFEIPYAPAILNSKNRKAFIQTFRELQTACLGLKPKIILSSGDREFKVGMNTTSSSGSLNNEDHDDDDVGALALRLPGDLINLLETVLRVKHDTALGALTTSGSFAIQSARKRRFGEEEKSSASFFVADVSMEDEEEEEDVNQQPQKHETIQQDDGKSGRSSTKKKAAKKRPREAADDQEVCEEGFIAF